MRKYLYKFLFISLVFLGAKAVAQPAFSSLTVAAGNGSATLTFSTGVFRNAGATQPLTAAQLTVTVSASSGGGSVAAGTVTTTVTHTAGSATATLTFTIAGTKDGSEILTVTPKDASSVYNGGGTPMTGAETITANLKDELAPAAPSTPDLAAADDTGASNSDNITSTTTNLTFAGTSEANASIQLYNGASAIPGGSTTANGSGNWTVDVNLAAGSYSINAKATDAASNVSAASGNLSLTIDTSAPTAPSTPDLAAADDTGSSNSDNITSTTTNLTFSGTSEANASIQLFNGASTIAGGSTTADGSGNWTVDVNLTAGTYSVNAKATDAAGNASSASGNLALTIDNTSPTPSIPDLAAGDDTGASSTDNITSTTTNLTFSGTSEANASIQLFDGVSSITGGSTTADGAGNWTVDVNLPAGSYSVNAKATDVAGNVSTASGNLTLTIDTSAPSAPSTPDLAAADDLGSSSTDNITSATTNLTFSGTSEANASIQLFDGASSIPGGSTTADGAGNWTVDVNLSAGSYSINAIATDAAGNSSTASANLSVTIDTTAPNTPSTPDLAAADDTGSSNTDNITSTTTNLTFSGTSDANIAIQLFNGASALPGATTTSDGAGNWTLDINLSAGSYSINAKASDVAGNLSSASGNLSVTIDNSAPAAPSTPDLAAGNDSGSSSTDNITNVNNNFVLSGTSEANASIDIYRAGSTLIGSTTANGAGNWTLTISLGTALTDAVHSITAKATDAAGNVSVASSALSMTVDTSAPATPSVPDLTSGTDSGVSNSDDITNNLSPSFTGTAENGATVQIFSSVDGGVRGSATSSGTYTVSTTLVTQGNGQTHSITAKAIDVAGNQSLVSSGLTITLDATAPTVTLASFFSDNANAPQAHNYSCNGTATNSTSTTEFVHLVLSEALQIADGTQLTIGTPGFTVSAGSYDTNCEGGGTRRGATVYHSTGTMLHLKSVNDGDWSGTTTFTFTSGGTNIKDVAGNEMGTFNNLLPSDTQAPSLASGLVFNPNGASPETITFFLDETLNGSVGSTLTGFTTSAGTIGSASYNSGTNLVTLTSTSHGMWTDGVTVSYSQASGNVIDPANNELANFSNEPILLQSVHIASNNATTTLAKAGNVVSVTFTASKALTGTPTATIGGLSASVTGTHPNYTASVTTTGAVPETAIAFTINALETSRTTDVTVTTDGSAVTFDNTAPAAPTTPNLAAADDSGPSNADNYTNVTTNLTFSGTAEANSSVQLFNGVSTIGSPVAANGAGAWTIDVNLPAGTYSINAKATDATGNTGTASGNLSLTIDTTSPVVSSITLPDANPNNTSSVSFTVNFDSNVTGVNGADFSANGTASAGTSVGGLLGSGATYSLTVSGITLTGTIGLTLTDNNSIKDQAGNQLGGPALNDGDFSSATQYTMILPEPPNHATLFSVTQTNFTNIKLGWTDATGSPAPSGYLITIARSGATATVPTDYTAIADQTDLINNTTGYINILPGVGSVNLTSILSGETYTFKIYPYTNSGVTTDYKTDGVVPTVGTTTPLDGFVWVNSQLGSTVEPATFPSTTTSSGVAVNNFRFQVYDNGWGSADNASTKITQIKIQRDLVNDQIGNWFNALQGAEISDGVTTRPGVVDPGGNFITFSNLYDGVTEFFGEVADNGNKYYYIRVILKTAMGGTLPQTIDNKSFVFKFRNVDVTVASNSSTLNSGNDTHADVPQSTIGKNRVSVIATQLDFTTSPNASQLVLANVTSTAASPDFTTVPVIRGRDLNGNTDLDYSATIALANAGSVSMSASALSMTGGVTVFPATFQYQDSGDGTLTASTTDAAANSLVPSPGSSTSVTVSYSATNTISPGPLVEPTSISTSTAGTFVNVFDFIIKDDNGAGGDGSPTRISQIVITPGAGNVVGDWTEAIAEAELQFVTLPIQTVAGTVNSNSLVFSGINPTTFGFIADNGSKTYRLRIKLKTTMGGTLPTTVDNQILDFRILDDDVTLTALSSAFTGSEASNSGNISINVVATKLRFTTEPTSPLLVGKNISLQPPVPIVEATDAFDNRDLNFNSAIITTTNSGSLSMLNTPAGNSFSSGLLTFPNNFQFTTAGTGITLSVAATGVTGATTTSSFTVRGGNASTITAGALSEPTTISSLTDLIHTPGGLAVFDFIINDDPAGTPVGENDGNPTRIKSITFNQGTGNNVSDWTELFSQVQLDDGTGNSGFGTINATSLVFGGGSGILNSLPTDPGYVADNGTKTYKLTIWLKTPLGGTLPTNVDGKKLVFEVTQSSIQFEADGTSILAGENENSGGAKNVINVNATLLKFTSPNAATSASLNSDLSGITVEAQDANGNRDLNFTGKVTALTNTTSATMINVPTLGTSSFAAGVFSFASNFQYTTGNNNDDVTLTVKADNLGGTTGTNCGVDAICGTSPTITLKTSFESALVGDPSFIPATTIPYLQYQANDIQNTPTSFELVKAVLIDGSRDGAFLFGGAPISAAGYTPTDNDGILANDTDGASTNLTSITLRIYRPSNIKRIALYSGAVEIGEIDATTYNNGSGLITSATPFYDFIWNGSPLITAADNSEAPLSFRLSFRNTSPEVTDGDNIQIQLIAATVGTGSQFATGPGYIGGQPNSGGPGSFGKIDVIATRLDFTSQPSAISGINEPVASPSVVKARDINGLVDLNYDILDTNTNRQKANLSSVSATLNNTTLNFNQGVLDFSTVGYTSTGDGTLTVAANGLSSNTGGSIACTHVDVIHVLATKASTGVISVSNLAGGSVNKVIFGVTFTAPYKITSPANHPKLNRFSINFSNPTVGVLKNFRIYESPNNSYDGSDIDVTNGSINGTLTLVGQTLVIDFSANPRDLSVAGSGQLSYFLMVDVEPTANGLTPKIQPRVLDLGYPDPTNGNIVTSGGSATSSTNSLTEPLGQDYSFASIFPPLLTSSYPAKGQLNVDPNQPTLDLVFSVPVWSLDQKVILYDKTAGTPGVVMPLNTLLPPTGIFPGGNSSLNLAGTQTNPLRFTFPPLISDHVYYVTIAKGEYLSDTDPNNSGIIDEQKNKYAGISYSGTLYFKTANPNPPKLLSTTSSPSAPNPTISNVSVSGATINATFDQNGKAYFLVVPNGQPIPTTSQIKNPTLGGYAGIVAYFGNFNIGQINPISQFGTISGLSANTQYNVWMYAENDALPTPVPTVGPYGSLSSGFVATASPTLPTLQFTTAASISSTGVFSPIPNISVCNNSYQILNSPITVVEKNIGDFSSGGVQTFNLLLPSGFQFDASSSGGIPVYGSLTLSGTDFILGSGSLSFINSSTLKVSYQNSGSSSYDIITISGLRVIASTTASGSIVRLGGNALTTAIPDLTSFATLSSFEAPEVSFTNSYSQQIYNSTGINTISDDFGDVQLIPLPPAGDYGSSDFAGPGVNIDQLSLSAVSLNTLFNITHIHTDNNGCKSQTAVQYNVYDHTKAIQVWDHTSLIKINSTKYCFDKNIQASDPNSLKYNIKSNSLTGYSLIEIKIDAPLNPGSQIMQGAAWSNLLKNNLAIVTSSSPDPNNSGQTFNSYLFDGATILNANSISGGAILDPYDNFKSSTTSTQNKTFYFGGSLGLAEFRGNYQSVANATIQLPLIQNLEFFVPAVPTIEFDPANRSIIDGAGIPVFCKAGGKINISGYPKATPGVSTGTFTLTTATLPYTPLTPPVNGFVDNGNGTAFIDPAIFDNGFSAIRVVYTFHHLSSPCTSFGEQVLRISPNPVASFTVSSTIGPNTPIATAYCENRSINFDASASTIASGTIARHFWDFGDATNATGVNPNNSIAANPSHFYTQAASYNPSLQLASADGCLSAVQTNVLKVGVIPNVAYGFVGVSTADHIVFANTTVINPSGIGDGIATLDWTFGDGNTQQVTSNFAAPLTKDYTNAGPYTTTLKVTSTIGCTASLSKPIIILPRATPTASAAYNQDFEAGNGNWQTAAIKGGTITSWAYGAVAKTFIKNDPLITGSNVWATQLSGPISQNEQSALYTPSFDLSSLQRPMISFNSMVDLDRSDGVIVEYSVDGRNIVDPNKQWFVLGGGIGEGTDWFNDQNLSGNPGAQTNFNYGWSEKANATSKWKESKHAIINEGGIKPNLIGATRVVFRFALGSNTPSLPTTDGFAMDNFRLGERTRTILLESFANTGNTKKDIQNRILEFRESNSVSNFNSSTLGTEVVKINYHVGFPGSDPFYLDNQADNSARALFYKVSETPTSRMDGVDGGANTPFKPYLTDWGINYFSQQSLRLAQAAIKINPIIDNTGISVSIDITGTTTTPLPDSIRLFIAVIEKSVAMTDLSTAARKAMVLTGETNFEYVLKKFLPSGSGVILTQLPAFGATKTIGPFKWAPDPSKFNAPNTDLQIIAFLQNAKSNNKEVYQSEITPLLADPAINVITGIEALLPEQVNLFPNPANKEFTIELPGVVQEDTQLHLIDMTGKMHDAGKIPAGKNSRTVDTQELADGIYILQIGAGDSGVVRKKVMIVRKE